MAAMIEVEGLSKDFGLVRAVNGISFTVDKGEVLGFLGPNGAGKSTTMKMITGFLSPTDGTARICGHDIEADAIEAKKRIGYLPEGAPLYSDMTPRAFLRFVASTRDIPSGERRKALDRAVSLAQLQDVMDQPIETLSKGFKRRVGLAQALLHDPDVLVLDEPTDGLDPNQKHEVRKIISDMAAEKAIIISTHILEEVDAVCSRAVIIAKGKIVADGTPEELEARSRRHNAVILQLNKPAPGEAKKALNKLRFVDQVEVDGKGADALIHVLPKEGKPIITDISQYARDQQWEVQEIRAEAGHLDEVFREITGAAR